MEYAKVNGLNPKASRIGLGTWSIGGFMWGGTDEQAALETIRAARINDRPSRPGVHGSASPFGSRATRGSAVFRVS